MLGAVVDGAQRTLDPLHMNACDPESEERATARVHLYEIPIIVFAEAKLSGRRSMSQRGATGLQKKEKRYPFLPEKKRNFADRGGSILN